MKNIILTLIIILLSSTVFGNELDKKINLFVSEIKIDYRSVMTVDDIINLNTGKSLELSEKIKNSLITALKNRFIILDRSQEKILQKEREKSISGYSDINARYVLIGNYEIEKEVIQIRLKVLKIDTSELIISKIISIPRSSVKMYLVDYSEEELDLIIKRQEKEVAELFEKQRDEKEKEEKLQQIREQKGKIERIRQGEYVEEKPKKEYKLPTGGYIVLYTGVVSGIFGAMYHSVGNDLRKKDKNAAAGTAEMLGNIFYLFSATCFSAVIYRVLTIDEDEYTTMQITPSSNKLTFALSKKF